MLETPDATIVALLRVYLSTLSFLSRLFHLLFRRWSWRLFRNVDSLVNVRPFPPVSGEIRPGA